MYKWRTKYNMAGPMLPEERFERIERQVEFLVEEGARLDNRIAAHQVQIEKHSEQIADLGSFLPRMGHSLENFAKRVSKWGGQNAGLDRGGHGGKVSPPNTPLEP